MNHVNKTIFYLGLACILICTPAVSKAQDIVSYAYDYAGNRISRKIVNLTENPNPTHVKKSENPAPVEEQLGERKITIYPNPTKGMLSVDINGGDEKDELSISVFNADGKQLLNKKVESGANPVDMSSYPASWYILRVTAGEKMTEFKIIKN